MLQHAAVTTLTPTIPLLGESLNNSRQLNRDDDEDAADDDLLQAPVQQSTQVGQQSV